MKPTDRKLTRFYIINPITDRRLETRFESREDVVIRIDQSGKTKPGVAHDIGQRGLKLECDMEFDAGAGIQLAFPNAADHIRCFGRVAWCRVKEKHRLFECGIAVDAWHGIIHGETSWKKYRGIKPRSERRTKNR